MPNRKNVSIKTHYPTKEDCINQLVDYKKKTFFSLFLRQISGLITDEGDFEISSRFNAGAFFEYKGHIVEETDGIYLEGHIKVKKNLMIFMIILSVLCVVSFPVYLSAWGSFGILFMIIIFVEICVIFAHFKYSDALYKDILRKLDK